MAGYDPIGACARRISPRPIPGDVRTRSLGGQGWTRLGAWRTPDEIVHIGHGRLFAGEVWVKASGQRGFFFVLMATDRMLMCVVACL